MANEEKCPVGHGAVTTSHGPARKNPDWWPNALNLKLLNQHSPLNDPMGESFNYAEEFKTLDLDAVIKDLACLDDDLAGLVAPGLRSLWAVLYSHGVAQRRNVSHCGRARRRGSGHAAFCSAK